MKLLQIGLFFLVAAAATQVKALELPEAESRVKRALGTDVNQLVSDLAKLLGTTVDELMDTVQKVLKQACLTGDSLTKTVRGAVTDTLTGLSSTAAGAGRTALFGRRKRSPVLDVATNLAGSLVQRVARATSSLTAAASGPLGLGRKKRAYLAPVSERQKRAYPY